MQQVFYHRRINLQKNYEENFHLNFQIKCCGRQKYRKEEEVEDNWDEVEWAAKGWAKWNQMVHKRQGEHQMGKIIK